MGYSVGATFQLSVGEKAFRELGQWYVGLRILGFYEYHCRWEGIQQRSFFSLLDPVIQTSPIDPGQCKTRSIGESLVSLLSEDFVEYLGNFQLSEQEKIEQSQVEKLLAAQQVPLNTSSSGRIRIFAEKHDFQVSFGIPRFEYSCDCDIDYTTHCLKCGAELTDHIARCPLCQQIRFGFERIAAFVQNRQELSAPNVFGERVMTDVQDPETGEWIGAFRFLEFLIKDQTKS